MIAGKFNPMADAAGARRQVPRRPNSSCAPLSPYAGKYAGYAIERGKLAMDVHYIVEPDGQLDAQQPDGPQPAHVRRRIESPTPPSCRSLAVALLRITTA